jgi:hypothetical protein
MRDKIPDPIDPEDPDSSFVVTVEQMRHMRLLLGELVGYIRVQYAKCGKQTTTPAPRP